MIWDALESRKAKHPCEREVEASDILTVNLVP
jgi:hypothetical protein